VYYTKLSRREAVVVCAALIGAAIGQTPAQRAAPAPRVKHDTIYVAVQSPPPVVNVEAPSQWPAVVLGVAGLFLLWLQLRIMRRQTDAMNRQTALADKQTTLLEQQEASRRNEAIATFYRIAFDLAAELGKANEFPSVRIQADYSTHPREMLREAGRLFAPLGNDFLRAATQVAHRVEEYFSAVEAYNSDVSGGRTGRWQTVQTMRTQVGGDLDLADLQIPMQMRWKYDDGTAYKFRTRCSMPQDLAKQIMGGPADDAV